MFGRDWQVEEVSVSARIAERKKKKK